MDVAPSREETISALTAPIRIDVFVISLLPFRGSRRILGYSVEAELLSFFHRLEEDEARSPPSIPALLLRAGFLSALGHDFAVESEIEAFDFGFLIDAQADHEIDRLEDDVC
jgi:hypothetical protein